jgi:hypothetical protein
MDREQARGWFVGLGIGAKLGVVLAVLAGFGFVGLIMFRLTFVTFVDNYKLGYIYYGRTGQIERLTRTGYVVTTPVLNAVHSIDLRPGQVCMNANARVLNCKLVRFNPDGFDKFIEWHGRGAGEATGVDVYEILKSYAFNVNEGRDCPFLTILDDMRRKNADGQVAAVPVAAVAPAEAPK